MSYKTSISNNAVTISLSSSAHKTNVTNIDHKISLSRTGGQGAKGDSVNRVYFDSDKNLLVEIVNANGTVIETINAGSMAERIDLIDLLDVDYESVSDGQFIIYDGAEQQFTTHTFTTTSISDIDNTNKADGSVLVYNGSTQKYVATNTIENENTTVLGGTF